MVCWSILCLFCDYSMYDVHTTSRLSNVHPYLLLNPPPTPPNISVGVLVNLGGYAGTAKSADIFALRPAAIAVSYMGFPGTMGSREMVDYILADGVVIPPNMRGYYSEKVCTVSQSPH